MHELLHENRNKKRPLLPILVVLVLFGLLAVGCKGRRAERYKRLRKDFPDSYRVALVNVEDPMNALSTRDHLRLDDSFQKELTRCPEFRITDPATLKAFMRQKRINGNFSALDGEEKEDIGEALDLEAFLVPKITAPPRSNRISLGVDLYNGYTGDVFWSRERDERVRGRRDRQNAYKRAFERIVDELRDELSSLVSRQKALRKAATPPAPTKAPTPEVTKSSTPAPTQRAELHEDQLPVPIPTDLPEEPTPKAKVSIPKGPSRLRFSQAKTSKASTRAASQPSYKAGAEQIQLETRDFQRISPVPAQGPLKSMVVTYAQKATPQGPRYSLRVYDQISPKEARLFLDDHFNGATPQRLEGCRSYAMRDTLDGRLAVGSLIGKFVLVCEAPRGHESPVTELAAQLVAANKRLINHYRRHPAPPEPKPVVRVINKPQPKEKVIREVRYKIRKVEVPQTIVPRVEIHLDNKTLLALVRDQLKSTDDKIVMRLQPPPTGAAPTKSPTQKALATASAQPTKAPTPEATKEPEKSDEPDPTATENTGALLRYNLGCRYMATNRFDKAEEEFLKAIKLDNLYEAPRYQLRQMKEQYGVDVTIPPIGPPTPTPPPTPVGPPTPSVTATPTSKPTEAASPTAKATKASSPTTNENTLPATKVASKTPPTTSGVNQPRGKLSRSRGNTVLLVGILIAIGLIVVKLLFLNDPDN